ncbi:MAG TPA: hypothetical protein DDW49_10535 [Deltaproteobacteria bacterium]|nr:hypothetical protein [Deltaproteobacteria bacterium]
MLRLFIFSFLLLLWILIVFAIKDRKFMKRKTRDVLGPELKKEIEEEKAEYQKHKDHFEQAMNRKMQKSGRGNS